MMDFFGSEETFPVCDYNAPKQLETVVTSVWKGNKLMTPLGGGVVMRPTQALGKDKLIPDEGGKVANRHQQIDVKTCLRVNGGGTRRPSILTCQPLDAPTARG